MEQAPLPLSEALSYARDVAQHLRELHEEGRVHGEVSARLVGLRSTGAILMPPPNGVQFAGSLADVVAFGAMFYEMLTSRKPTAETLLSTPLQGPPRKGPGAVQASAVRLAERCLTAVPESGPTMQKVLTELRLLSVRAQQCEKDAAAPEQPGGRPRSGASTVEFPAELEAPDPEGGAELIHRGNTEVQPAIELKAGEEELDDDHLADGRCPRCRCSKVRISRPRNRLERFLNAIGMPVRRCHRCYFRYIDLFKACLEMPTKKFNR